jgi:hypothetical protein
MCNEQALPQTRGIGSSIQLKPLLQTTQHQLSTIVVIVAKSPPEEIKR